jgi:small subunit ribosomal protein S4
MFDTSEKRERSTGTKLFLKPHRCNSPKCVTMRRAQRPGQHGKNYKSLSEYGQQVKEKQKIRFTYGIREGQMKMLVGKAIKNQGVTGEVIMQMLERRLDNTVFRMGLAPSRSVARQMVNHGHIIVNKHRTNIPSYQVRVNDVIFIRPQSREYVMFKDLAEKLKKYEAPSWLKIDAEKLEGKVVSIPKDLDKTFDVNMVVDYYSK